MDHSIKQKEITGLEEEDEETDLCIVCCSSVKDNCAENKEDLLSSNLSVIFLLRKVLQVPDSQLEENLRECGDPVEWIRLCEQCSQLTRQAEELHWEMIKIKEQLRSVHQLILDKTRTTSPPSSSLSTDKNTEGKKWKRKNIWRKTRDIISTGDRRQVNLINPFIEGDKLANYLQSQQNSSIHYIKVEVDHSEGEDDDGDDDGPCDQEDMEWEPPEVAESEDDQDTVATSKRAPISKRSKKRLTYEIINGKFKCPSCDKVFANRKTVHQHVKDKHSGNVPQVCGVCGKEYATQMSLAVHIRVVHNKQLKRSCHLCSRRYAGQFELNVHLLSRHKEDPATLKLVEEKGYQLLRCPVLRCTVIKIKQSGMDEHLKRMHSSDNHQPKPLKKFPCQFCPRVFSQKENRNRHQLALHDTAAEKPFKCDICGLAASSLDHLSAHMRRIHKIREKISSDSGKGNSSDKPIKTKVICHLCGIKRQGSTAMRYHMVSKHRDDPLSKQLIEKGFGVWRCKVRGCSATYTNKLGLDEHVTLMHGGMEDQDKLEMSYFCAFCGKGFCVEEALQKHERFIHGDIEGTKRFKCEICGFETTLQAYLKRHIQRVHKSSKKDGGEVKGDKVANCNICGRQFRDQDKLEKHKMIHDKEVEQPYPCDICGRAYSTHQSMRHHKRKAHKIYRRQENRSKE